MYLPDYLAKVPPSFSLFSSGSFPTSQHHSSATFRTVGFALSSYWKQPRYLKTNLTASISLAQRRARSHTPIVVNMLPLHCESSINDDVLRATAMILILQTRTRLVDAENTSVNWQRRWTRWWLPHAMSDKWVVRKKREVCHGQKSQGARTSETRDKWLASDAILTVSLSSASCGIPAVESNYWVSPLLPFFYPP